jgi:hypothetical protein
MNLKKNLLKTRLESITIIAIVFLSTIYCMGIVPDQCSAAVKGEMDFYQIDPVNFSFQDRHRLTRHRTSAPTRLWYTYFKTDMDKDIKEKPLFVFLNGGPGCGTSMNLFSMNTAPYTLDRNVTGHNRYSAKNPYTWTALGNLLYIDAPNTGFSYMLGKDKKSDSDLFRLKTFFFDSNYNAFIDASQVLRFLFMFLEKHDEIRGNRIILVGESYSGVRVTTMLNMLLQYEKYADGSKVFRDAGLKKTIENHFRSTLKKEPPFSPEDIKKQFASQVLIQPQIVDKYQIEDKKNAFMAQNSLMDKLGKEAKAEISWREFLRFKGVENISKFKDDHITEYLLAIDRDQYNCAKESSWTDDNEFQSMSALTNVNELKKITNCDPRQIKYFLPQNRKNALRFPFHKEVPADIKRIIELLKFELSAQENMLLEMFPYFDASFNISLDRKKHSLEYNLGQLNDFDSYLVGTNPYIFLGFMTNSGAKEGLGAIVQLIREIYNDIYDISPGERIKYGTMFLENLIHIDTFMTHAANDIVVYSPTLISQFDKNRFSKIITKIDYDKNWPAKNGDKPSDVNFHYRNGSKKTLNWYYYNDSGHAVSSSEPEKFRNDVAQWLKQF